MVLEASAPLELGQNAHIAHIPPIDSKFALQPITPRASWLVKMKNNHFILFQELCQNIVSFSGNISNHNNTSPNIFPKTE